MKKPLRKLRFIGHTQYSVGGFTAFLCDLTTSRLELMLLEMILEASEEDYEVLEVSDHYEIDEITAIKIVTNVPVAVYDAFNMTNAKSYL